MNFYPFTQSIELTSRRPPAEVLGRVMEKVRPVEMADVFRDAVLPRGTIIGAARGQSFEMREALYGFGGAAASGTVVAEGNGSRLKARIQSGLYMSFGVPVMTVAYGLICYVYFRYFALHGLSLSRFLLFSFYTLVFLAGWTMMTLELRAIRQLLKDAVEGDR